MSLKIIFAEADLARVTVATGPDPMWEVLLSLHAVQDDTAGGPFARWRDRIDRSAVPGELRRLAPARGYSPDFLTPDHGPADLDDGIDAIRRTPRQRLHRELRRLAGPRTLPGGLRALATGDNASLRDLTKTLCGYHRGALRPYWPEIEHDVREDRAQRARVLLAGGVAELLATLHPMLTWHDGTLELHGEHVSGELRLAGRGLRLIPSFFCHGAPTVLADPELRPVLVYPIKHDPDWLSRAGRDRDERAALAALLGPTRAQVLDAAATGCTTTELSRRVGISAAAASYHTSIMRDAGLITTRREGSSVRHTLTALGRELLAQ